MPKKYREDAKEQKKRNAKNTKNAKEDFEELKKQCEEYLNGWKRAQADYQNLEKQTEQQMSDFRKYANQDMLMQILPLVDYFKHAFNAIPEDKKDDEWLAGIKHIQDYLYKFLEDNNVEEIKTIGEKFDPAKHEVVKEEKGEGKKEGVIIKEIQSGFTYNGQVIQPAKVIINKK